MRWQSARSWASSRGNERERRVQVLLQVLHRLGLLPRLQLAAEQAHALQYAQGLRLGRDGERLDCQRTRQLDLSLLRLGDPHIGEERGPPTDGLWIKERYGLLQGGKRTLWLAQPHKTRAFVPGQTRGVKAGGVVVFSKGFLRREHFGGRE